MYLASLHQNQVNYKIYPKIARFYTQIVAKGGLNNLIFSIGFRILKVWFFYVAQKKYKIWSKYIKTAIFSKKLLKFSKNCP